MALCTRTNATDQVLEAMRWYWGLRHCRTVTFVADVAGSLNGEYWDLNVIEEDYTEKKYLVYLDNGSTTAPTPASDQTLLQVSYTDGDSAATIAAAFVSALTSASIPVNTETTAGAVEVQNKFVGLITTEVYTNASNLTFSTGATGIGGYLGQTGSAELAIEESTVPLVDDAQGTTILSEVFTGITATISFTIKEMTTARWESLIGNVAGATKTISTNDITGYGTSKLFTNKFNYAGRLVGHPVRLANSDRSADICMKLTAPKMTSINYSGADVQEASFEFPGYKDSLASPEINIVARGDHSLE